MKFDKTLLFYKVKNNALTNRDFTICLSDDGIPNDNHGEEKQQSDNQLSENICAFCKQEFNEDQLGKLSVYNICKPCKTELEKKIFPLWVKLFFAGVLLLVVFSLFWNQRFYNAFFEIRKANKAFTEANITKAAYYMNGASNDVPESKDVSELASYYIALDLISKDRSAQALAKLENCKDLPPEYHINELALQTKMSASYDAKDYNLFLKSSKAVLQLDTTQSLSWAGVASAYSCLYTQNGLDSLKLLSLKYLNKAKTIDDTSKTAKEYYGRIAYRLDSKQIVSQQEFLKKYPNGYPSK